METSEHTDGYCSHLYLTEDWDQYFPFPTSKSSATMSL